MFNTHFLIFISLENKDLELVMPLVHEWRSDIWVVSHFDLHRNVRLMACPDLIKKQAQAMFSRIY